MNKSYNPLKMWGSWAGLFIFGALATVAALGYGNEFFGIDEMKFLGFFTQFDFIFRMLDCSGDGCMIGILTTPLTFFFYGFLIGWAIHSIFRN